MRRAKKTIQLKYGELFCGPGGMGLGAKRAYVEDKRFIYQLKHQWACDADPDSCLTYQKNVSPLGCVLNQDVRSLDIGSLAGVDVFSYGFPCNDFSIVGEQKGIKGAFGPLYKYGVEVLNQHNPKAFIAENVGGLVSANKGQAFACILQDLKNAGKGYRLVVHKYRFEEYGVPQMRHRIIITGIRRDLNLIFRIPRPTHTGQYVSVKEALENPPIYPGADNHHFIKVSNRVAERLKYIKPWRNIWNSDMPESLKIHSTTQLSHIYRRLDQNKPSYTITGSGGGGTYGYHWREHRPLTNRERARIQTFPDDFIFEGSSGSVRRQIGMAVPPKIACLLFEAVLKTLFKIPYPFMSREGLWAKNIINSAQLNMRGGESENYHPRRERLVRAKAHSLFCRQP